MNNTFKNPEYKHMIILVQRVESLQYLSELFHDKHVNLVVAGMNYDQRFIRTEKLRKLLARCQILQDKIIAIRKSANFGIVGL